ncbi:MAG: MATE family efflux transporter [Clostridiales bacterium]|nr:MATE family efflux transporter [Clostridiales bacterium]
MEQNRTGGSVFKTLVAFSLPYLLSYFLQTLYGLADLFIIGQFNGVDSTTAVSVGSQVMHMITVMIVGLAMGSTVMIGRAVGANRREEASLAVGNTAVLFMGISLILTGLLLSVRSPIIRIMKVPPEAVAGITDYLTICFVGIPFITAYNVISSIFRGMGDSKSPMYFIAVACCVNIALDYFLIGCLGMGPAGAALGTTLSQTVSVLLSFTMIVRKQMIRLSRSDFRMSGRMMKSLLSVGIPVALQDGFIQISFLVITAIANSRGLTDAAAVGIVEKIIGILFLVPSSMLSAVSALCAQNIGAGRLERARQTLLYAIELAVGFGLFSALCMSFAAEPVVGLFVGSGDAAVIRAGGQYLRGYVWDCVLAGIHFSFSGYFCACQKSGLSFLHNTISIVFARIPLAYLASTMFPDTLMPMGIATAIGSGVSVIVCLIAYQWMRKRENVNGY